MDETEWRKCREEHIDHLADKGITTATEYVETFHTTDPDQVRTALEEMTEENRGLQGFYRQYPRNDQDVMIVNSNPKLSLKSDYTNSDFRDRDNYLLSVSDSPKYRKAISVAGAIGWFETTGQGDYPWNWLAQLDSIPGISTPWPVDDPDDVKEWILRDQLQNVYYTNWYKMASKSEGEYRNFDYDKELARKTLSREIESVSPDVIVTSGGQVWSHMFKENVQPSSLAGETQLYKVHGFPFYSEEHEARVIPLHHFSSWKQHAFIDSSKYNGPGAAEEDRERLRLITEWDEQQMYPEGLLNRIEKYTPWNR